MISGTQPSPRTLNPDIPDAVLEILKHALQRDPGQRFASAAKMGEACEHFLYDKGYGPTNLTLKQYLGELFPDGGPSLAVTELEPTLFPMPSPSGRGSGPNHHAPSPPAGASGAARNRVTLRPRPEARIECRVSAARRPSPAEESDRCSRVA